MNSFIALPLRLLLATLIAAQALVLGAVEPTPAPWELTQVATVDPGSPSAVDPDGQAVAFIRNGLRIRDLASGGEKPTHRDSPSAIAWSPDGQRLAAAFVADHGTTLRLFSRLGELSGETHVQGRVTSLGWRTNTELLAFAIEFFRFRFGTRLTETLARWDGRTDAILLPLEDTTLMPARMAHWERTLPASLTFELSPLGDEILYTRLNAPPALPPSLKLVLRHLENGKGRILADVSLKGSNGTFSGDGRFILYGDGVETSFLASPWDGRDLKTLPEAGRQIALSPSGRTALLDGRIYRDGVKVGAFRSGVRGQFAARTGALFVQEGGRLSQVTGLPSEPLVPLEAAMADRLRQRQKWLAEGLISPADYAKDNLP